MKRQYKLIVGTILSLLLSNNVYAIDSGVSSGDIADPDNSGICRTVGSTTAWTCADGTGCYNVNDGYQFQDQWITTGVEWVEYKYFRTLVDGRLQYGRRYITYGAIVTCPEPPPDVCTDQDIQNAIDFCGGETNVQWDQAAANDPEFSRCNWTCKDSNCTAERDQLEQYCAAGIATWNEQACTGTCVNCDDVYLNVYNFCKTQSGVYSFDCKIIDSSDPQKQKQELTYSCNGAPDSTTPTDPATPPPDTDPGTTPDPNNSTPPDPNDPLNQPQSDPTIDPTADPAVNTNNWLETIKKNQDTITNQNNDQIGQLNDIVKNTNTTAKNTETIANNQSKIQDEIRHSADVTRSGTDKINETNKTGFKNLTDAINGLSTSQDPLDLSQLAASGATPTLTGNEFDSSLPTDTDYTKFSDNTTLAGEQASTYAQTNLDITTDNTTSPINAEVTATGDPCLSGNISLRGQAIPVNICFNRPWMLTGYSIMKLLMIGLGYLQTAILLNKAISN